MFQNNHFEKKDQFLNKEGISWVDAKEMQLSKNNEPLEQISSEIQNKLKKLPVKKFAILTTSLFLVLITLARLLYPAEYNYSIYTHSVSSTGDWVHNPVGFIFYILGLSSFGILAYPLYKYLVNFAKIYSTKVSNLINFLAKISSISLVAVTIFLETSAKDFRWMRELHGIFAVTYFTSTAGIFVLLTYVHFKNYQSRTYYLDTPILNFALLVLIVVYFGAGIGMFISFMNLDFPIQIVIYTYHFQHWSFFEWIFVVTHSLLISVIPIKIEIMKNRNKLS